MRTESECWSAHDDARKVGSVISASPIVRFHDDHRRLLEGHLKSLPKARTANAVLLIHIVFDKPPGRNTRGLFFCGPQLGTCNACLTHKPTSAILALLKRRLLISAFFSENNHGPEWFLLAESGEVVSHRLTDRRAPPASDLKAVQVPSRRGVGE